jgi:hypothetical protein
MSWKLGFALLCALACSSSAQNTGRKTPENPAIWEPPSIIEFPHSAKSTVPKEMIKGLRVSGLKIVLEDTELAVVQSHIGGTIGHRGDAGDSLSWLCLHGIDPQGDWVLWLMSGEIDAGTVGGFRWQRVESKAKLDARCKALPEGRDGVELPVVLRLGITEDGVRHIFGQPSTRLGNAALYSHEHEGTIRNEPFTAMNTLAVLLRGGVVWAIEVWKSTTS